MTSGIRKRSIVLDGRKTSVSVEDPFWDAVKEIAWSRRVTVAGLISGIDAERDGGNLSSHIRLAVLDHYRNAAARAGVAQ